MRVTLSRSVGPLLFASFVAIATACTGAQFDHGTSGPASAGEAPTGADGGMTAEPFDGATPEEPDGSRDSSVAPDAPGMPPVPCAPGRAMCSGSCLDLTSDAANCGACGKSCGAQACIGGECNVVMATGLYFPERVAAGASSVFFSDKHHDTIYALPLAAVGGAPTPFVTGLASVDALAALDHQLFYETAGEIHSVDDAGSNSKLVVSGVSTGLWTINNGRLYYVTVANRGTPSSQSKLMTADLDGSGAQPLGAAVPGTGAAVGAGGCAMYWQVAPTNGAGAAVTGVPLTGGPSLTVAAPDSNALTNAFTGLASDAQYVYFNDVTGTTPSWMRALRTGGITQIMGSGFGFQKLLTDGNTDFALSGIMGMQPNGSPALALSRFAVGGTTLATLYSGASDFDIQAGYLYVTDPNNGLLVRIAKGGPPGGGINASATCMCNAGYVGDGKLCRACASNNGGCDVNATCTQNGAVVCSCKVGYTGTGTSCTSQCAVNNGGCDAHASCSLGASGVTCTCRTFAGYEGDGKTCTFNPCLVNNGSCDGGPYVSTCTNNGGVASCACKAPFSPYGPNGAACYLNKNGTFSPTMTMYLQTCTPNVGALPILNAPSTWTVNEPGGPPSNVSLAVTFSGCSISLPSGFASQGSHDLEFLAGSASCDFADVSGDHFTSMTATGGRVQAGAGGTAVFGSVHFHKGSSNADTVCDYVLEANF